MQNRCSPTSITRVFRVTLVEGEGSWERRGRMNFQRKKMFVPSVMKINLFHLKIIGGGWVVSSAILHCYVVIPSFAQREKKNQCKTFSKKLMCIICIT